MLEKSSRVHILGREYRLLVTDESEGLTREIVAYVNSKMTAFRRAHPEQPELTTAVITALALAEELYGSWEEQDALRDAVAAGADDLTARLDAALEAAPDAANEDARDDAPEATDEGATPALTPEDEQVLD